MSGRAGEIDLITPERYEEFGYPHAEWTWLRAHAPVFWYERPNVDPFWAITKHADIVEIGKRPRDFLIAPRIAVFAKDLPVNEQPIRHLLTMDAPDHASFRNLVAKRFTPRRVGQWTTEVRGGGNSALYRRHQARADPLETVRRLIRNSAANRAPRGPGRRRRP